MFSRTSAALIAALALAAAPCMASNEAIPASTATLDMQVMKEGQYSLNMVWRVHPSDAARRQADEDLDVFRKGPSGAYIESRGVPITYIVSIYKLPSRERIFTGTSSNPRSHARHGGRGATLASLRLEPGNYQASVTTVLSTPALRRYKTELAFGPAHHGK